MRVIQFPERGRAVLAEMERPECEPKGILIRTLYSGLSNGTERNILLGGNYGGHYPAWPGYQVLGEVVETGELVRKFVVGDLVFCANCGFGHWEYLPAEADSLVVRIAEDEDPVPLALLAVAAVAYRNTMRLGIRAGEKVLVMGGGVIGQVAAQLARNSGGEVTLVAGHPEKLASADRAGIHNLLDYHSDSYREELKRLGPWNAVLETSGADVLDMILGTDWNGGLLANEGRLALVAGRDRISYCSNAAQSKAVAIYQSAHFNQDHLEETLALVRGGDIGLVDLVTAVHPIGKAPEIYDRLRDDPGGLFGTVFKW